MTTPPASTPDTSSSTNTAPATNYEQILELGKQLSDQLDPHDILGRWMSHHIADLVCRADEAVDDAKQPAQQAAADAIMTLWGRRDGAPWRQKPHRDFKRIFAALERLAPEPGQWGYIDAFDKESQPTADQLRARAILAAACDLDRHARRTVRAAVALAAHDADSNEEAWAKAGLALVEDETARAVGMLRSLELRMRLKASEADDAHEHMTISPEGDDPMLHALNTATYDAVDALLRIHSAVSPAELDTSQPEPTIDEKTSAQPVHPTTPQV